MMSSFEKTSIQKKEDKFEAEQQQLMDQ